MVRTIGFWGLPVLLVAAVLLVPACSTFAPVPLEDIPFKARAETEERDGISVSASVLTRAETRAAFGKKVDKKELQPVWLEIENNTDEMLWLLLRALDANYFSPQEAALAGYGLRTEARSDIGEYFEAVQIPRTVPPGTTVSGFVFGNLKLGTKEVKVRLIGEKEVLNYEFFITVPGLRADWQKADFDTIYEAGEIVNYEDAAEFRQVLEEFPCCTTKKDGTGTGDPINMVVIASPGTLTNFVRAGWDETEIITAGSSWRTLKAFVSGGEYKYSPISALYVFQRPQEISLQKARDSIHERNHLRLWLAPFTFRGKEVWMGGISRDIGVFWTTRTWNLTSHAIDSEIDEARNYITEDLAVSQGLKAYGYVGGVGVWTPQNPEENLLGTPWWTDGRRVVLELADAPTPLEEVDILDWANLNTVRQ